MAHLLFLSHAGADTERAIKLAAAIESSPEAQAAGLKVWVDKRPDGPHRLHAGTPWQDQLEVAIAKQSTSFGLLLTREGARNWVRLEVRVALDRVIAEQRAGTTYPFVPIIADDPGDLAHLPPFAQQYQGVRLTGDGMGLADLVRIAARLDAAQPVRLVAQPFMGLEAFEAKDAALFFGRRKETQELVDRLRTTNLVLVTGDSGSGKSSLVKAGLIPAFREGALADPLGRRPEPGQWHVVEMRPGTDPFEGLVEGVGKTATGRSLADQGTLNEWVRTRDPDKIRDALRLSGPPCASLLLVVDQFEELWTLTTDDTKRRDFLAALLALVPEGDLARRVVGTMRRDYYHLHTDYTLLRDRLVGNGNAGRFLLGAMAPDALRDIVVKPLLLAGENEAGAAALADEVVKDVAGEPGNLALVEMALHASWDRRRESGGDLALAYQRLDRLEGALAHEAEDAFWNPSNDAKKLTERERPIAEALFMRLVRAGDAGGATRRPVAFTELEQPARTIARKLATPECRRLVVLREPDGVTNAEAAIIVELSHEQLVTQWPDYRFWLRGTGTAQHEPDATRAVDKRAFDRLMDAASKWDERGQRNEDLARGGELNDFVILYRSEIRNPWLSSLEVIFVSQSINASEATNRRFQRNVLALAVATIFLLITVCVFSLNWHTANALSSLRAMSLGDLPYFDDGIDLPSSQSLLRKSFDTIVAYSLQSKQGIVVIPGEPNSGYQFSSSIITFGVLYDIIGTSSRPLKFMVTGGEILGMIEKCVSGDYTIPYLRILGISFDLDLMQASGQRVKNPRFGATPLERDKRYSLVTIDRLLTIDSDIYRWEPAYSDASGYLLGAVFSYMLTNKIEPWLGEGIVICK